MKILLKATDKDGKEVKTDCEGLQTALDIAKFHLTEQRNSQDKVTKERVKKVEIEIE